jgi:hypothetical protein
MLHSFLFYGVVISPGVIPVALGIRCSFANKRWCIAGAVIGLAASISCWLGTAAALNNGTLTIATTGQDYPMLVGNCVGLGSSSLIALIGSYFQPEHYDWLETRAINSRKEQPITEEAVNEANQAATVDSKAEKLGAKASARPASPRDSFDRNAMAFEEGNELVSVEVAELRKAFKLAGVCSGVVIMVTDGRCSLELDHPLPDPRDHCAPLALWQRLRVQRTQLHCLGLVLHCLALRRIFLHPLRTYLGGTLF